MTRQEAQTALGKLHQEFRVGTGLGLGHDGRRPRLIWSARTRKGRADHLHHWIRIGPRCWRGVEHSLIHEYAHIVTYRRFGGRHHHDEVFYRCLVAVAQAHFGDARRYAWGTEYRSLIRRAIKDGYLLASISTPVIRPAIERGLAGLLEWPRA